jgi:hypothetical protein
MNLRAPLNASVVLARRLREFNTSPEPRFKLGATNEPNDALDLSVVKRNEIANRGHLF